MRNRKRSSLPLSISTVDNHRAHRRYDWTAHFDVRRRAADQRGDAAGFVGILGEGRHKGKIDVYVRINKAREYELAGRVDDLSFRRSFEIFADASDGLVLNVDVAWNRDPTVTISPFRISNAIFPPAPRVDALVNLDAHLCPILLHLLPVFRNFAL